MLLKITLKYVWTYKSSILAFRHTLNSGLFPEVTQSCSVWELESESVAVEFSLPDLRYNSGRMSDKPRVRIWQKCQKNGVLMMFLKLKYKITKRILISHDEKEERKYTQRICWYYERRWDLRAFGENNQHWCRWTKTGYLCLCVHTSCPASCCSTQTPPLAWEPVVVNASDPGSVPLRSSHGKDKLCKMSWHFSGVHVWNQRFIRIVYRFVFV